MSAPLDEQLRAWGKSLREIDPSMLSHEHAQTVRWFQGEGGTELFVWSEEGRIVHVQLVFARTSIEWIAQKGLQTGTFARGGAIAGGRYDPYLLRVEGDVDVAVARSALTLLEAAPLEAAIVEPLRKALKAALGLP